MATEQDPEEFIEEDEQDEIARRSIFSAGWFRALLVLTVLAIVVVVSLPYLLNWLEPTPSPPAKPSAKVSEPAVSTPSAPPPAPATEVKPPAPPAAPAPSAKSEISPPAAKPEPPPSAQAPASPAERPVGTAPLPAVPAPSAPAAKPAPAAKAEIPRVSTRRGAAAESGPGGGYWVQVGAFVEERNAEALSKQLKGENFPVTISRVSRAGGRGAPATAPAPAKPAAGGQNQLFITGSTPDAVNAALKGKGTAQSVKGGVVVNPPYDLETAMSLSSSLKKEGFKVVIRRAKAEPAPAAPSGAGTVFHVVRVGGYPNRAKAQQVRGELEAKGHPGFLSQGAAR
jgi:cell division septation protein DedD